MRLSHTIRGVTYGFADLKELLAKASPLRSGDELAGISAATAEERVAARFVLAGLPLSHFLNEVVIPYESDEVTRLIVDSHNDAAFAPIASFTVGEFRNWLLDEQASGEALSALAPGLTPEMVAAVSKLMQAQDLVAVARKIRVVTRFRTTVGLSGRLSTRLQPNHPTDDPVGIAASIVDGLSLGSGDAVIGINPASDERRFRVHVAPAGGSRTREVCHSHPELRAGTRHYPNGGAAAGCTDRPDLSIHWRDGGNEQVVRNKSCIAG